jgi:hypothetical protein
MRPLPVAVLLQIFSLLSDSDLASVKRANRAWGLVALSVFLARRYCLKYTIKDGQIRIIAPVIRLKEPDEIGIPSPPLNTCYSAEVLANHDRLMWGHSVTKRRPSMFKLWLSRFKRERRPRGRVHLC